MPAYITSIGTANPGEGISQHQIAEFMTRGLDLDQDSGTHLKALYRATGIQKRHSVIPDYGLNGKPYSFYPKTSGFEPFPSIKSRMEYYKSYAVDLAVQAIDHCIEKERISEVTHLITVSCTGMYAPGMDIELIERLDLDHSVERTAINFMGCYAAFSALKIANRIAHSDDNAKVLVVCVELCSLHFQRNSDEETILANSLFADGAAAVLVEGLPSNEINLQLKKFYGEIDVEGKEEMSWNIGDFGFEMKLSFKVPTVIENGIRNLTGNLLSSLNKKVSDIDFFAIHPGGKKILEVIERQLQIPHEKNAYAYQILRDFGNMSSPTVLFVLQSIMLNLEDSDQGKSILSFAFGPGLTMESMLLEVTGGSST